MDNSIQVISQSVQDMERVLCEELLVRNGELQEKKLWDNSYIKHQIDKRKRGCPFLIEDHIRAMVYAMLSGGIPWERVVKGADLDTGRIAPVDEVFLQYNPQALMQVDPEKLVKGIFKLNCGNRRTKTYQIPALRNNIEKFCKWEHSYGSIENYYKQFEQTDPTMKALVKRLSSSGSPNKMQELGIPLAAEYLRNVGYDIAKPDRHIRRILGNKALGLFEQELAPEYKAMDKVAEIARELGWPVAKVDYIMWSYYAKGYGGVGSKKSCR